MHSVRIWLIVAMLTLPGLATARGQSGICGAGGVQGEAKPPQAAPMTEAAAVVFGRLARRVDVPFAAPTPLSEVLAFFRKELCGAKNEPPVAVYLDPIALQEAAKTAESPVTLELPGVTLARGLELALGQLGLRHDVMPDGLIWISTVEHKNLPRAVEPVTAEAARTWSALFKKASMPFPTETPLGDVIKYVKSITQTSDQPEGLPIYLDPVGLKFAEKTEATPLRINLEGQPLEVGLRLGLKSLGLTYRVRPSGLLFITDDENVDAGETGVRFERLQPPAGSNALLDAVESLRRQLIESKTPAAKPPGTTP